ncbi:hypothetical protein [Planctopirus hydrillae]|uniref:Knr4/Smi1-like domain-containing protein n=1 Tax=Planctopirus hydrillae TaxID=1841610 RepID=A0A1C3ELU6_9PLAN|nr:hypothetical protein [Planctopirus hydrillae]ODA34206.1 hypothetical protein A6X21_17720 [Planctopirus hydrillae]
MELTKKWHGYSCDDYVSSPLAKAGYWDEPSQLWLIEPCDRIEEEAKVEFLQVGRPGVDDIGFGYRKGQEGFWAIHRMEGGRFQYLAPSIQTFLDEWFAGQITV